MSQRITPNPDEAKLLLVYEGRGLILILLTKYDEAIDDLRLMLRLARALGNRLARQV